MYRGCWEFGCNFKHSWWWSGPCITQGMWILLLSPRDFCRACMCVFMYVCIGKVYLRCFHRGLPIYFHMISICWNVFPEVLFLHLFSFIIHNFIFYTTLFSKCLEIFYSSLYFTYQLESVSPCIWYLYLIVSCS